MSDEKTNVSEPLLTHRNTEDGIETGGANVSWEAGRGVLVNRARGQGVGLQCRPGCVRCRGGVSSSQALAWNRRTCRPDTDRPVKMNPWGSLAARGRTASGSTASGRVPWRGTGADRPVVAVKAL